MYVHHRYKLCSDSYTYYSPDVIGGFLTKVDAEGHSMLPETTRSHVELCTPPTDSHHEL